MNDFMTHSLSTLLLALAMLGAPVIAADPTPATVHDTAGVASDFEVLLGEWVRPDGGYTITVSGVDPEGTLDAAYLSSSKLPFEHARASQNGDAIEVFLELRAGGYNGSTYNLTYDAATDTLQGVYYQAVAQQKFNIYFERVK